MCPDHWIVDVIDDLARHAERAGRRDLQVALLYARLTAISECCPHLLESQSAGDVAEAQVVPLARAARDKR